MDYRAFEVSVDARGPGEYEVSARGPSGEARTRVRFPFPPDALGVELGMVQQALEQSRALPAASPAGPAGAPLSPRRAVERFGEILFQTLLSERVLVAWRASVALAERDACGLRLQLRLQAPEIAALPWELMFDPDDASFVCLNPATPLVRYPEIDRAPEPLAATQPLRVLGMIASPCDLPQLDKSAERDRIERALAGLIGQHELELRWIEGGTYRDLQRALRDGAWHVFHFIGHGGFASDDEEGTGEGVLALESTQTMPTTLGPEGELAPDRSGPARMASADLVGRLLRGHPSLRLVLLNSCLGARASAADVFSSTASTLVRRGIPAVIAMQNEITDRAAVIFAQAFYTSLASGVAVDRAVTDARTAISAANEDSIEWGTPVLLMRSPDGILFEPAGPARKSRYRATDWARVTMRALATSAVLPLLAACLGAVLPAPGVDFRLDARVSGAAFTLTAARALAGTLEAGSIGAAGLGSVTIPAAGGGAPIETDRMLLTVDQSDRSGRITLDLTPVLPRGTRVALQVADEPGRYLLTLGDSVPPFSIGVSGNVQVLVPGTMNERIELNAPGVIVLTPTYGVLSFEVQPSSALDAPIEGRVPVAALDLTRVDRFESGSATELREVSTILSGHVAVGMQPTQSLAAGEELRVAGLQGELVSLKPGNGGFDLAAQGHAERMTAGSGTAQRSLVPSALSWLVMDHGPWLAMAGALYLLLAALTLTYMRRRQR